MIREHLTPVEGPDGIFFPATYAAAEDKRVFPGGYNIDPPEGDKNVCQVDSVGSQANRIEPIFGKPEYAKFVPQVTVKAGEKSVNLLEAGHRAGDALVRCTALQKDLQNAFKAVLKGNPSRWPKSPRLPLCSACGTRGIRKPNCRAWSPLRFAHSMSGD